MKIDYFALAIAAGVFLGQAAYGLTKLAWAKYELQQVSEWFKDDRERTRAQSIQSKHQREQEANIRNEKRRVAAEEADIKRTQELYAQRRKNKARPWVKARLPTVAQPTAHHGHRYSKPNGHPSL